MAKPIGPKTLLIREAIGANPDLGNTELATLISGSDARKQDKITVTANDVAQQRQAMKKAGTLTASQAAPAAKKRGRPKGSTNGAKPQAPAARVPAPARSPVDLIDRVFDLAAECGGMGELRRLVERLAPPRRA